jgi:4-amino-4-deoxy-L-arabinose transferase-like glycosyltransferase
MQIGVLIKKQWIDVLIVTALVFMTSFLTLYTLGNQTLHPWDEAWYATIARNIVRTGDILDIRYNQFPFWDHPPLGFYATALSFGIFGMNDFSARLPQALFGVGTILIMYATGTKLKNRWVGIVAALILVSSRWFLFRARTGNLDSLLIFTQALFFLTAFTTKEHRRLWLPAFAFGLAMSAKSFISLTLSPLLWLAWHERNQIQKIARKEVAKAIVASAIILLPWYGYNTIVYGLTFLKRNIFEIGLREGSTKGVSLTSLNQTNMYFRAAVHRWYSFFVISTVGGTALLIDSYLLKNKALFRTLTWLFSYLFLVGFPYLLSAKTEIWHLIPVIAPMALIIAFVGYELLERVVQIMQKKLGFQNKLIMLSGSAVFTLVVTAIAANSLHSYWTEFINLPPAQTEVAIISSRITDKNKPLFLTDGAFYPTQVYYSDMNEKVSVVNEQEFSQICTLRLEPFQFITTQSFLDKTTGWVKKEQVGDLILVEYSNHRCGPKEWPTN